VNDLNSQMSARMRQRTGLLQMRSDAARAETHGEIVPLIVPLEQIVIDEGIQVRVAGLNAEKVAQYAVVFEEGGEFPPVVVFRDEETDELYLGDGFHRLAAAERAGLDEIEVEVRPGGYDAAVEHAEEANLTHGLNLSTRDKRFILERRIRRGHEWASWSNRALAAALGVDEGTIRNWRKALEKMTAENSAVAPTKRVGVDGREYDVSRIQDANRRRAEERRKAQRVEYVRDPAIDQTVEAWDEPVLEVEEPEPPSVPGEDALYEAHRMTPRGHETMAGESDTQPVDPTIRRAIVEALSHIERYHRPLLVEHVARQCSVRAKVVSETLRALEAQGVVVQQGLAVGLAGDIAPGDLVIPELPHVVRLQRAAVEHIEEAARILHELGKGDDAEWFSQYALDLCDEWGIEDAI